MSGLSHPALRPQLGPNALMTLKNFKNILATVYFISAPHVRTIVIIHHHKPTVHYAVVVANLVADLVCDQDIMG